jgi:hypothetical protein
MKDGKLSKREQQTLENAMDVLNRWCDYHSEELGDFGPYDFASNAAGAIRYFLYEIREND